MSNNNEVKKESFFSKIGKSFVKAYKSTKKFWDDIHKPVSYKVGHISYKALSMILWTLIVLAMPLTMLLVTTLITPAPFWWTFYSFLIPILVIWVVKFYFARYKKPMVTPEAVVLTPEVTTEVKASSSVKKSSTKKTTKKSTKKTTKKKA